MEKVSSSDRLELIEPISPTDSFNCAVSGGLCEHVSFYIEGEEGKKKALRLFSFPRVTETAGRRTRNERARRAFRIN